MAKPLNYISSENFTNPFLSEDPKEIWKKAEKGAKPIPKKAIMKRAQELKEKYGKADKQ